LSVTQDSWFSVRDKGGKEVFSGIVHAGDTKEVAGEAPFKVTVGNKAGLESLTLDGQPVDPSKYSAAKGNVARFALP
jgi:cytoskeleton protein RodZ